MSTEFFNDQWRIPSNENQNKVSNYSMDFNGTSTKINCGDSDKFSFGDVTTDRPFSLSGWVKPDDLTRFKLFGKFDISNTNYEYQFGTSSSKILTLSLYNQNTADRIQRSYNTTLTSLDWQHWVATYDGSGNPDNIKIYINGVQVGDTSNTVGTYTAMQNTAAPLLIASESVNYANGKIDQVTVFDYELSQEQVTQLGAEGYAFKFANDIILFANGSTMARQQNISYSVWVKSTSLSATRYIVGNNTSSNKGTSIFLLNDVLVFQIGNNGNNSYFGSRVSSLSNYVNANEWFHVAASWDGTDSKIYINGVERNSWTPSQPYTISGWNNNFIIGRRADSTSSGFYGELSNVAFWDSGLTPAQVQTIYNNGTPNDISLLNPVGWWKLNQQDVFVGPNWTITDYGSGGNDGTSSGMTSANLIASNINGELITNPMITSPKPIAYYQLGDQSVDNGANYLVPNNSLSDYVFNIDSSNSNYIDLGTNPFSFTQNLTVSFWIKSTQTATNTFIGKDVNVSGGRNWMVMLYQNKVYFWTTSTGNLANLKDIQSNVAGVVSDGKWHHIVCVNNQTNVTKQIYIDGVLDVTNNEGGLISTSSSPVQIGKRPSGSPYDGEMSNVALWDTALTGPQVATIYNNGKPNDISSLNPVAWYKLDDTATFNSSTSVWTIPDDSSNSNNGTSVAMTSSSLVASNINGELIANPMITSPKPIAYYQLGDQSVDNGANLLVPNNSLSDYVFDFDGANDYIDLGSTDVLFNSTQGFSFSAWVKLDSYTNSQYPTIAHIKTNLTVGWLVFLSQTSAPNNYAGLNFGSNTGFARTRTDGNIAQDFIGKWKHIAIVYDGVSRTQISSYTAYIDGSPVALTNSYLFAPVPNANSIGFNNNTSNTFDGSISNVSTFSTELSSTQVETLYNNGAPNDISSLSPTAWYKLNAADTFNSSTSTWTINDYGSGGNDGTSSGMTSANLVVSDLQQTSGYSPYALDFDGINDYLDCGNDSSLSISGDLTISAWVYINVHKQLNGIISKISSTDRNYEILVRSTENITFYTQTSGTSVFTSSTTTIPVNTWTHIAVTVQNGVTNGTKFYFNGVQDATTGTHTVVGNTANLNIGRRTTNSFYMNGKLSNVALWNTNLTSTQVTEIYNEGVPSNLNNFSGTAPVAWWQLGSNSSYNSGAWTCLDEIGTNNAVSVNMTNDDIVDGVGYSASGVGTSSIDIKGDAPYSTANGLSENMDVLDRTTDVPS